MEGLEKLLAMPYGCGEQNMLNFAPNVYIMDYLTATQQNQSKIKEKSIKYMKSGINSSSHRFVTWFVKLVKFVKQYSSIFYFSSKNILKMPVKYFQSNSNSKSKPYFYNDQRCLIQIYLTSKQTQP